MTIEDMESEDFTFPHISDVVMASERLIFNTTEDILLAMQDLGINQSDLAKKMGRSKSFVSQVLDGTRNLTLKTLSDITHALGAEVRIAILKDGRDVSYPIVPERKSYITKSNFIADPGHPVIRIIVANHHMDYEQNVAC